MTGWAGRAAWRCQHRADLQPGRHRRLPPVGAVGAARCPVGLLAIAAV